MRRFGIFPPRVGEVVLKDLEMLMRGGELAKGAKLHHLERTVNKTRGEALEAGAVVTVGGKEASLPPNPVVMNVHEMVTYLKNYLPVISWLNDILKLPLLGEDHELDHPRHLLVGPGHQVAPVRRVVMDLEVSFLELLPDITLIKL